MNKILCVFNICGISGRENIDYYFKAIDSILSQKFDGFKVVVSSCLSSKETIDHLLEKYDKKFSINWIKDKVPVNISFNHSVLESIKRFGEFKGYLYLDSGCSFENQTNILEELYNTYQSGPYGMVTLRTDTNTGFPIWFNIGMNDDDSSSFNWFFRNLPEHFIIPVGKSCNMHCHLYSNDIIRAYGKPWPDIFASEASESPLSFLNAAISKKWIIHKDIEIHHQTSLDGPSSGFAPWNWVQSTGRRPYEHGFNCNNILERIKNGYKFGLGYEEVTDIARHDPSKFDSEGYALYPELKDYIKNNLFLKKEEFDYDKINYEWIN